VSMAKSLAAVLLSAGMASFPIGMTAVQVAHAALPDEVITARDGPYTVRQETIQPLIRNPRNKSEMEVRQTTVSKDVAYSDLDLSKDADVATLQERVRTAAIDVCREADRRAEFARWPVNVGFNCVADAKLRAKMIVKQAVADARSRRGVAKN